jgi:mono/diheme cytochrome c family protein
MKIRTALVALSILGVAAANAGAPAEEVARGRHLVELMSCAVCHSPRDPKTKVPIPGDFSGSMVGRHESGIGLFFPPNLTSDKKTGLGDWTDDQIADALLKGMRPDGRELSQAMPWKAYKRYLRKDEASAIVAYLRTLKPIKRKTPDPIGVGQKSPLPYYRTVPAGVVEP